MVRRAREEEAEALTRLARDAKASWPYPAEWLDAWAAGLTITPDYLKDATVFVAPPEGPVAGMVAITVGEHGPEIEHLWVAPDAQGRGIGRALVEHVIGVGKRRGWEEYRVVSDPYAEAFYLRMGATRIGEEAAPVLRLDRWLPVLALPIRPEPESPRL